MTKFIELTDVRTEKKFLQNVNDIGKVIPYENVKIIGENLDVDVKESYEEIKDMLK